MFSKPRIQSKQSRVTRTSERTAASSWDKPLSPYQRLQRNPALFFAHQLYAYRRPPYPPPPVNQPAIKIVCLSDTHNTTPIVPDGDVLLHAGDLTNKGSFAELQAQLDWLNRLPHPHKLVIAGNHDFLLDPIFCDGFPHRVSEEPGYTRADLRWGRLTFLNDSSASVAVNGRTITIYGSPMTPQFGTWAFQHPLIRDVWTDKVPAGTDIILTHGPPRGHLDLEGKGCVWLLRELWRSRPRLVVCGHIHAGRGVEHLYWDRLQKTYDGINLGEKGLMSVLWMALILTVQRIWFRLAGRTSWMTTLANAAVVAGVANSETRPTIVVEI